VYHSITFWTSGSTVSKIANTYDDFCLVPETIAAIAPPMTKRQTVDIPGGNGLLDLTDSLRKYPVYNNREGSITFHVLNDRRSISNITWPNLYSKIMNLLQGRLVLATLDDDPGWYYKGRWDVSAWSPSNDGTWPKVQFNYYLQPYKLSNQQQTLTYTIPSSSSLSHLETVTRDKIGEGPVVAPTVTTTGQNTTIKVTNSKTGYSYQKTYTSAGSFTDAAMVLYDYTGNGTAIYAQGTGSVTFKFNKRSL